MKIRKTEPSVGILGKIVNLFSNSTKDTYSCDYINKINNYSTEETFTGKYWIDGKPIYRKVIDVGNLPNADVKNINHNIVGLENITFSYGNASNGSTHINLPNVHAADLISQVAMFVTNELIRITTGSDRSTYIGYVILEYTKTTD